MAKRKKSNSPPGSVGFKSPPREHQFKKGKSGNPAGRPKGALNVATILTKTLRERIEVTENGRRKKITRLDAAVKQLANKAATGDVRSIQQLLGLTQEVHERTEASARAEKSTFTEADEKVMESLLSRLKDQTKGGNDEDESE
jgi:hypothetical protein